MTVQARCCILSRGVSGLLQGTKIRHNKAQNKNHNTKQRVVVLRVLLQPYSFPLHINKHWKVSSHAHHNKTDRAAPYSVRFHLQQKKCTGTCFRRHSLGVQHIELTVYPMMMHIINIALCSSQFFRQKCNGHLPLRPRVCLWQSQTFSCAQLFHAHRHLRDKVFCEEDLQPRALYCIWLLGVSKCPNHTGDNKRYCCTIH